VAAPNPSAPPKRPLPPADKDSIAVVLAAQEGPLTFAVSAFLFGSAVAASPDALRFG